MPAIISPDDVPKLRYPHVGRGWFVEIDLPSGIQRYFTGVGRREIDGKTWYGVNDPIYGQVVDIDELTDPRFGTAPVVVITVSGVSLDFVRSVKNTARQMEGRDATISFCLFDGETEESITDVITLFPGSISRPVLHRSSDGTRHVQIAIESFWESQNFPGGRMWSSIGLLKANAGDLGGEFIGVKVAEKWK